MSTGEIIFGCVVAVCATLVALVYITTRYGKNNTKESSK